jgi:E1A/CREB-binding protein
MNVPIDGINTLQRSHARPRDDANSMIQANLFSIERSDLSPTAAGSGKMSNNGIKEKIAITRNKQQRLSLMYHSANCRGDMGCKIKQHCAKMKILLHHMAACQGSRCAVAHCATTSTIYNHYLKCKDINCPVCAPVRNIMRNASRNSSSMSAAITDQAQERSSTPRRLGIPRPIDSRSTSFPIEREGMLTNESVSSLPSFEPPSASQSSREHHYSVHLSSHEEQNAMNNQQQQESFNGHQCKSRCIDILTGLQTHQHGWVFNSPVDPVLLGVPDYFEIIKTPMDLGSVETRLKSGFYKSIDDFARDVYLTFNNATAFNEHGSNVYNMAKELEAKFIKDMSILYSQL